MDLDGSQTSSLDRSLTANSGFGGTENQGVISEYVTLTLGTTKAKALLTTMDASDPRSSHLGTYVLLLPWLLPSCHSKSPTYHISPQGNAVLEL